MEVEGVAQHQLVAEPGHLRRGEAAHAALGRQRDECRSGHLAMPKMNQARAGIAITGLDLKPEPVWIRPDPVRLWGWLLLLAGALDGPPADLHSGRLGLLGLRDVDLEHSVLEVRLHVVRIDAPGERDGSDEAPEGALDAPIALSGLLFLGLALAGDRQDPVLDLDVDVVPAP